ncbi:MAG: mucoidy inhibitor MuiA family protein [Bacteroidales bacterium]|nr:mucoidy inhibitor MuiA family protein [Bacteroidales bacterium]MBN2758256.1 mucoidy inhibitor MuiA family protein [Bacteroidales bacterium]
MLKKITLFTLCIILPLNIFADDEKKLKSDIKEVTVYLKGAQITRNAETNLKKGKTVIIFAGLSSKIYPESIQISGSDNFTIISVVHNYDYLNEINSSKEIEIIENKRDILLDSINKYKKLILVYQQEKEMILTNKSIGGQTQGVSIHELKSAADFFRSRLTEIELKLLKFSQIIKKNNLEFIKISRQLAEQNVRRNISTSEIRVTVSAEKDVNANFVIKYIINNAGWEPNYDIRIKDVNNPLRLIYKAKVFQNTDENWENVKLNLSTGNPSISSYKPNLEPYYLSFNNYYKAKPKANTNTYGGKFRGVVSGIITDNNGEPIPGASITVKGDNYIGTISDLSGYYELIVPNGKNTLVINFIGMKSIEKIINSDRIDVNLESDDIGIDEVVVTALGKPKGRLFNISKSIGYDEKEKKEIIPLAIEKTETNTVFKIDIPYSIPSDNKKYDVSMVEYNIPAEYEYSCVPKLSEDAYLMAKITNWEEYSLLSAQANIFYEGTFKGNTFIDLQAFEDTLKFSVGRDKDIVVSRKMQKEFSSKKIIGTSVKELRAWELSVRNNKFYPVKIIVEDQFPVSNNNDIKVELIENSGAIFDETTGKLTWKVDLESSQTKQILIKYEVKFPKNKNLIVE